ncbi:hypothetical protein A9Q99_06885 [Gammaproteobacteria bacterium 45_16_T64]|nr:hypothetical protein A9Q99_06885 [Gammaproteobacteria bacterium 45_16_T64]
MNIACKDVDESYLHSAPMRFVNEVILDATPEEVFAIFEDENSWPKWFKGIKHVEWTSPKPYSVGTTRTVTLDAMKVYEHFIIWEQNKRFAFYFTSTGLPFVKSLCEDYQLEAVGDSQTRFIYTVACDPILLIKMTGPLAKYALGNMFKNAAESLRLYIQDNK